MIKNLFDDDDVPAAKPPAEGDPATHLNLDSDESQREEKQEKFIISEVPPQSMAETVRQSGLAWSAGIALFSSVVFLLILGWLMDLLLGSSPWGVVIGIILGSVIGFIQFFRITSQIFKK